ncbi:MAG: glycogen synthase GlgA [Candidatus Eisenbacteria bacterium]
MIPLKVLFVTAEAAPFAKTGGLADVSFALPRELAGLGHDVRVVLPLYPGIRELARDLTPVEGPGNIVIRSAHYEFRCTVLRATFPGTDLGAWLVDCPELFDRPSVYTQDADEHLRFIVLTRAAIELAQRWQWAPDIAHAHDWHTALLPLYLKTVYAWDRLFERTRSLVTIHNLGHQGVFGAHVLGDLGLGEGVRLLHQDDLRAGRISFLKTGLLLADRVSTVSPTYAREIQGEAFGFGLDGLLRARGADLVGILNGIDTEAWNPATDPLLAARYSAKSLYRKEKNKQALLESVGLPYEKGVPTLGIVTRLSHQKGIELIEGALPRILAERNVRFVALGSGDPHYEGFLDGLAHAFPGKARLWRGFSERLAHMVEAGSDLFLMPSLYEPCGLNQMYSQRYGTPPVVRRAGGLADTVEHFDRSTGEGTGFVFEHFSASGLEWAIGAALEIYSDPKAWTRLVRNAMQKDYGWGEPARRYAELYTSMIPAEAGRP